jgi:hypothetical protein
MKVPLIKATFKGGPWDGLQLSVAEGQQFLVVKSLKNNDEENVDAEIEKCLYAVDAAMSHLLKRSIIIFQAACSLHSYLC